MLTSPATFGAFSHSKKREETGKTRADFSERPQNSQLKIGRIRDMVRTVRFSRHRRRAIRSSYARGEHMDGYMGLFLMTGEPAFYLLSRQRAEQEETGA